MVDQETFDLRLRTKLKDGQRVRVAEITYIPSPEAERVFRRAVDILFGIKEVKQPQGDDGQA